jgi:ornithine--oxo-acid transaminase
VDLHAIREVRVEHRLQDISDVRVVVPQAREPLPSVKVKIRVPRRVVEVRPPRGRKVRVEAEDAEHLDQRSIEMTRSQLERFIYSLVGFRYDAQRIVDVRGSDVGFRGHLGSERLVPVSTVGTAQKTRAMCTGCFDIAIGMRTCSERYRSRLSATPGRPTLVNGSPDTEHSIGHTGGERIFVSQYPPLSDIADLLELRAGEALALNQRHLNPKLGRVLQTLGFDVDWAEGHAAYLIDRRGRAYLDLLSGYGMFAFGRNHPYIKEQLRRVLDADTPNLPQLGVSTLAGVLGEQLIMRSPASLAAVLLTSSGTEAVEGAMKLARAATGKPRILYCERGFHGLSLGALSVNGNVEFRERFGQLLAGCKAVPFGDLTALERELSRRDVAAFIVEPVQGKGVYIAPDEYLAQAQTLCRRVGTLFIIDEVQTGLGRTGRFLALEHWGLQPDMITLAKALSGGFVPAGALLASREIFNATFDSMERSVVHGSTFGGGDLAATAALAALAVLDREQLVTRARKLGELLLELTLPLVERFEIVRAVRGLGLMWAIELGPPAGRAARRLWNAVEHRQPGLFAQMVTIPLFRDHRILTQVAGHHMNVIKALPPLVIEENDLRRFVSALEEVLGQAEQHLFRRYASLGFELGRRSLSSVA